MLEQYVYRVNRKFTLFYTPIASYIMEQESCDHIEHTLDIPIGEKYTLWIEGAAKYFRIGVHKPHKLCNENQDADWILWNSNRAQIKRKKFEHYIDTIDYI